METFWLETFWHILSFLETLWSETLWTETFRLETFWHILSFLETLWSETFWPETFLGGYRHSEYDRTWHRAIMTRTKMGKFEEVLFNRSWTCFSYQLMQYSSYFLWNMEYVSLRVGNKSHSLSDMFVSNNGVHSNVQTQLFYMKMSTYIPQVNRRSYTGSYGNK